MPDTITNIRLYEKVENVRLESKFDVIAGSTLVRATARDTFEVYGLTINAGINYGIGGTSGEQCNWSGFLVSVT